MSDDLSFDVKVAIQRAVLFHPLFEGTAADALEIAIAAIKAGDEICAPSPAQEPVTTELVAWLADWLEVYVNVRAPMHDETRFRRCIAALRTIPAPPQPGRNEIARIIEARVLGGAAWEEPQASCYRAADAILALAGEPK